MILGRAAEYLKAVGYSHPAQKIFLPAGSSEPVIVNYTLYYPPDTGAISLWLHSRDPKRWKRRSAPPEDPAPPVAAQEAERKRKEDLGRLTAAIEERTKLGLPPLLASAMIVEQRKPGTHAKAVR